LKKKKRNNDNTGEFQKFSLIKNEIFLWIEDDESEKSTKKKKEIYSGSNLSELVGYKGWNIDSSFEDIIKKKDKQKKRQKKMLS
jgi:hypothetical protein